MLGSPSIPFPNDNCWIMREKDPFWRHRLSRREMSSVIRYFVRPSGVQQLSVSLAVSVSLCVCLSLSLCVCLCCSHCPSLSLSPSLSPHYLLTIPSLSLSIPSPSSSPPSFPPFSLQTANSSRSHRQHKRKRFEGGHVWLHSSILDSNFQRIYEGLGDRSERNAMV